MVGCAIKPPRHAPFLLGLWLLVLNTAHAADPHPGAPHPIGSEYHRKIIYHSPQTPGYTCWVGVWPMPDQSLMVTFKQATGPLAGRERSLDLFEKMGLSKIPAERDFTGLRLAN